MGLVDLEGVVLEKAPHTDMERFLKGADVSFRDTSRVSYGGGGRGRALYCHFEQQYLPTPSQSKQRILFCSPFSCSGGARS